MQCLHAISTNSIVIAVQYELRKQQNLIETTAEEGYREVIFWFNIQSSGEKSSDLS